MCSWLSTGERASSLATRRLKNPLTCSHFQVKIVLFFLRHLIFYTHVLCLFVFFSPLVVFTVQNVSSFSSESRGCRSLECWKCQRSEADRDTMRLRGNGASTQIWAVNILELWGGFFRDPADRSFLFWLAPDSAHVRKRPGDYTGGGSTINVMMGAFDITRRQL